MILLDTHVWIWFVNESPDLDDATRTLLEQHRGSGLGVSDISC